MSNPLHALFIEDSAHDAELILAVLQREGFQIEHERVQTADAVKEALGRRRWDIILCDYVMPELTAPEAIRIVRAHDAELPLIIVSGTVGEEQAVEAIQLGATDYLLKDRLAGLGVAIRRALEQHKARIERDKAHLALRTSEARYHALFEYAPYGIVIADRQSNYLDANANVCRMLGYARAELIGMNATQIVVPAEVPQIAVALQEIKASSLGHQREWRFRRKDGSTFAAEVIATEMPDGNLLGMIRDITERRQTEEAIQAQLSELRRWHVMTLGREEHIISLKREINELLAKQGQPPRYSSPDAPL
jgi:PAS domain S-box-containing protein